ncbi:MAG: EamA family transporter, partial [Hyphomicrobiales bacterium]|nr:EamA family transporter [Hyphomicrobiales bacterium]
GVGALFAGGGAGGGFSVAFVPGYLLAAGCALTWSTYSVLSRRFPEAGAETVAAFCAATSALALICHLLFETNVAPVGAAAWASIVALGLGPVGLAFYVWDHGVKRGDIGLLGVFAYATPALSTLLLVATGFAAPSWGLAIACGLVMAGAAVATGAGRRAVAPAS